MSDRPEVKYNERYWCNQIISLEPRLQKRARLIEKQFADAGREALRAFLQKKAEAPDFLAITRDVARS